MWGFGKKSSKLQAVQQQMAQIINETFPSEQLLDDAQSAHGRSESRCVRNLPCILFPADQVDSPSAYATAVTLDLSFYGLSIIAFEPLELTSYAIAVGNTDRKAFFLGTCRYCHPAGLGCYMLGFSVTEVLGAAVSSKLKQAVEMLETAVT